MIIHNSILQIYESVTSDMIDYNFGVNCKLFFGTNKTICPNCIFNDLVGNSTNEYKTGGPIPFTTGICPYCMGIGFRDEQATSTIKLRVYFDKKQWARMDIPVNVVDGAIQTIGHLSDMVDCKRANKILVHSDLEQYNEYNFVLASDPVPFGLTKKEFLCYWNRLQ